MQKTKSKLHLKKLTDLHCCILLFITSVMLATRASADVNPLLLKTSSDAQAENQATQLMKLMTPGERFDFVGGTGFGIRVMPRLGIPALKFSDASCGLRLQGTPPQALKSTAFPCTLLLAATWDSELSRQYGQAVAEEFRAAGIDFILGPGMDIYRSSNNGRNFEYLGEDPYLAGCMVAAYVHGAQGLNVATTLKHYLCNETDKFRRATDSVVGERALHEIYLQPFAAGVDAGAWGVMTSYNPVNGEWASQNHYLVTDLLRHELGFNYLVMTDWGSTWYGDKLAKSGVDIEMGSGVMLKRDRTKVLGTSDVDRMVVDILKTGIVSGLYELEAKNEYQRPEWVNKLSAHEKFAETVNEAGIVLLKNTGLLPLPANLGKKILVTGNIADLNALCGIGSGHVDGYNLKNYLQAVQETFGADNVVYKPHPDNEQIRSANVVLLFTGFRNTNVISSDPEFVRTHQVTEGEAHNRPFQLPEDAFITRCVGLNPRTVVTVACGGGVQMDWAGDAAGIFHALYGGQTGPEALMNLVTGKVNPSGKLPFSIEQRPQDSLAFGEDDAMQPGRFLADPKDLAHRVGIRAFDFLFNKDKTEAYTRELIYKEGVFIGYRWYDHKNIEPRFPFGYGLSYTTFSYQHLQLSNDGLSPDGNITASVDITNTGQRAGAEVVELYLHDLHPKIDRPVRELKGFAKVMLEPGETKSVSFTVHPRDLAYFDVPGHQWHADAGDYEVQIGASERDIRQNASFRLTADFNELVK